MAAAESGVRSRFAWGAVGLVAAAAAVVRLAVSTRYGWHRDEFYYVICGRHPAWGYVDQPPLTPLLARVAAGLPGGLLPLRLVAIALQIGCILLAAALAAELGGRPPGRQNLPAKQHEPASFIAAVLLWLPVLSVRSSNALRQISPVLVETYGWPQFVEQVAAATADVPADVPFFTSNYGEAGALSLLGPARGVDRPVFSGHNNYALWGPPPGRPDTVLCVGRFKAGYLQRAWGEVREISRITLPDGVENQEKSGHAVVSLCSAPKGDWAEIWPGLGHLD